MINILSYNNQSTELSSIKFTKYSDEYCYIKDNFYHYTRSIIPSVFNFFLDINHSVPTQYINHERSLKVFDSNTNNLYPIAVRYVSNENVYVIERPPFKLSVDFKNSRASYSSNSVTPVEIWIPWTVMILPWNQIVTGDPGHLKLYFNDGPIKSLSDCVVPVYLPNSYPDGRICWSHSFNQLLSQLNTSGPESIDLNYLYSSILNDYLMGGWNTDLQFSYRDLQYKDSHHTVSLLANKDLPMLSLFVDTLKINPDFAKNIRSILETKFGFTKRKSLSCVDGSVLKDRNNHQGSRDIFLKLFAFMSSISLSDTLNFVSELKHLSRESSAYGPIEIEKTLRINFSPYDDNNVPLLATTAPIKNAVINNSIDTEYQTIKGFIVYLRNYTFEESGFISHYLRRGDNLEQILNSDFISSDDENFSELLYLDIYNLCMNRYNSEPHDKHEPFVIVINGDDKTISIHNIDYLNNLFSNVASQINQYILDNKNNNSHSLKNDTRISEYILNNLEQQNV